MHRSALPFALVVTRPNHGKGESSVLAIRLP